jgi:hypothetical protein
MAKKLGRVAREFISRRDAIKVDTGFYADIEDGIWYVFGDQSGFAYESYSDEHEAKARSNVWNKLTME